MAVSRPLLLILLGVVLVAVTFTAARSARHSGHPKARAPLPHPTRAGAPGPAPAGPVRSGRFRFRLTLSGAAEQAVRQREGISASGAFQGAGALKVPRLRVDVVARGGGGVLRAGAVSLGNRGFLTRGRTGYALPRRLWSSLRSARSQVAAYAKHAAPTRASLAPTMLGFDSTAWLKGLRRHGTDTVDGTETTHLSGAVDTTRVLRDLGGRAAAGPGARALRTAGRELRGARTDLYVGRRDGVVRRLRVQATLAGSGASGARRDHFGHGRVEMVFDLTQVNRPQRIASPRTVRRAGLPNVGRGAGVLAAGALAAGAVAIDQPGLAAARRAGYRFQARVSPGPTRPPTSGPRRVRDALAARRKVVVCFFQPRSLDDDATAAGVARLRRRGAVTVVADRLANLDHYGPLVGSAGVSQAPAIVIIGPSRRARLLQGYVDAETLAQEVRDTR
jgi:hypothetical protein